MPTYSTEDLDREAIARAAASDEDGEPGGRECLSRIMHAIDAQRFDSPLFSYLANCINQYLRGGSIEEAFNVVPRKNPEGTPAGKHGVGRHDTEKVLALRELARRRVKRKGEADTAVAEACGYKDADSVSRLARDCGYTFDHVNDEMLKVMAGDDLLKRVGPTSPAPDAEEVYEWDEAKLKSWPWSPPPNTEAEDPVKTS